MCVFVGAASHLLGPVRSPHLSSIISSATVKEPRSSSHLSPAAFSCLLQWYQFSGCSVLQCLYTRICSLAARLPEPSPPALTKLSCKPQPESSLLPSASALLTTTSNKTPLNCHPVSVCVSKTKTAHPNTAQSTLDPTGDIKAH